MAITIPQSEMELCEKLMTPAWAAAALQNDIFSWEKERDAAQKSGKREIVNAVWVLMGEFSISEHDALEKLRIITKGYVRDYVAIANIQVKNENLSSDLRRYLQAILWSLSGNIVWSIQCPRYNPGEEYNVAQLALMDWGEKEKGREGNAKVPASSLGKMILNTISSLYMWGQRIVFGQT